MSNNFELVECDDCHDVKPIAEFRSPGHTPGGTRNGFDVDTSVCAECARRSYEALQAELAEAALAGMAAEEQAPGVSVTKDYRQIIPPLIVGNRWVYWIEQEQSDGSRRGFPLDYPQGVKAWRTDQFYIGGEQMSGTITEHAGRTPVKFRSAIVSVTTPTREQYDGWQAARGQLVSPSHTNCNTRSQ